MIHLIPRQRRFGWQAALGRATEAEAKAGRATRDLAKAKAATRTTVVTTNAGLAAAAPGLAALQAKNSVMPGIAVPLHGLPCLGLLEGNQRPSFLLSFFLSRSIWVGCRSCGGRMRPS